MAAIDEIYRYLNEIAPFSTAMDFDNAGFLVGDGKTEVTKALVTLDITAQSVRQAREKGAQLIVSHHPVIFHPLKRLLSNSVPYLLQRKESGRFAPIPIWTWRREASTTVWPPLWSFPDGWRWLFTASFLAALWEPLPSLWSRKASRRL